MGSNFQGIALSSAQHLMPKESYLQIKTLLYPLI
jgi:hypothetical protein